MANVAAFSRHHFSRMFKQTLGISPREYLFRGRIAKSQALLVQTTDSVAEIAFLCGYNSQSAFTTAFRKMTGTTPARFRRANAKDAGDEYVDCPLRVHQRAVIEALAQAAPAATSQSLGHLPADRTAPGPIDPGSGGA